MKRSIFLKQISILTAGSAIIPSSIMAKPTYLKKLLPEVGIQLFSIPLLLNKDFEKSISMISKMGYTYLEFFGPYYFSAQSAKDNIKNYPFPPSDNPISGFYGNQARDVKNVLSDYNLKSPSLHTDLDTLENHMGELAKGALECGAEFVVLPAIPPNQRTSIDDYKRIADRFNLIGLSAKKEGISFAYHNHGYGFVEKQGIIPTEYVFENTDPDLVFLQMDIFWTLAAGQDPINLLNKYSNRYKLMHLKDMKENILFDGDGESFKEWIALFPNMTSCGKGVADIKGIINKAKEVGVKHFYVEQDMAQNPQIVLQESFDFLTS
ncbi:MAG: sugar phosphate isomerase/epimerase [Flavobacteriaceae bacterium]|jgi:sugar phosphate isomerase/epimerase|nr:sugar phosphate isomerase/epimerase [Flavobacteriaceae bacterium]MBT3794616.1 sugar phosphate isomerase/epimerase [Flavobacteriaceae bacterium]MBT4245810.1 sugar phosphate isomerase/epimerase [Flavobacteriaceae bacterium]MBT4415446.1 sugar phosphate isomerase/epimerase [Flavobacteriaceae bacterium]MBT5011658.1 sugar phosphate isomerase/epimerase [Flavobacteriaceae bacterium]|tara:strand:+ start:80 stop:1045 length:966 start_codon:yes stop_codon:yes gene_type:complete